MHHKNFCVGFFINESDSDKEEENSELINQENKPRDHQIKSVQIQILQMPLLHMVEM